MAFPLDFSQNKQSIEWIIVDPFQRDLSALDYSKLALRVGIPPGSLGLLLQENIHKLGYIKYGGQLVIDPDTSVGKF